ncbi:unnamed protein product [Agarophyton chilense]
MAHRHRSKSLLDAACFRQPLIGCLSFLFTSALFPPPMCPRYWPRQVLSSPPQKYAAKVLRWSCAVAIAMRKITVPVNPELGGFAVPRACRRTVENDETPCPLDPYVVLPDESKFMGSQTQATRVARIRAHRRNAKEHRFELRSLCHGCGQVILGVKNDGATSV